MHLSTPCSVLMALLSLALRTGPARAHGRLVDPPSRSTMWRYGFKNPPNYNDHELFCGGLQRMIVNGKCGLCGDPADMAPPRPNEAGGKYANGIIVRRYRTNQLIETEVELTAHHKGYFEFKICATNDPKVNPTQKCFDEQALHLADGSGSRYHVPKMAPEGKYRMTYALPKWLGCSLCVIQWTYVAGNNWGRCENGTESIGCGVQETFRACADVAIGVELDSTGNDVESNEIPHSAGCDTRAAILLMAAMTLLAKDAILFFLF